MVDVSIVKEMRNPVVVHVYDISQGLARQFSDMFLGKHLDGIWHTGTVVFGLEYYFGGGIQADPAGQTPFGQPYQVLTIGETTKTRQEFEIFLRSVSHKYTPMKYHLLENNCNNFSSEVCRFLTGRDLPDYVVNLPNIALDSPLGRMIRPLIDGFYNVFNTPPEQFLPSSSSSSSSSVMLSQSVARIDKINLSGLFQKAKSIVDDISPSLDQEHKERFEILRENLGLDTQQAIIGNLEPVEVMETVFVLLNSVKNDSAYPFLDILALLLLRESYSQMCTSVFSSPLEGIVNSSEEEDVFYVLTRMRVLVSLLCSEEGREFLLGNEIRRTKCVDVVTWSLLEEYGDDARKKKLIGVSAKLAHNLSMFITDEDILVDIVSAICHLLSTQEEVEEGTLRNLLSSVDSMLTSNPSIREVLLATEFDVKKFDDEKYSSEIRELSKKVNSVIEQEE